MVFGLRDKKLAFIVLFAIALMVSYPLVFAEAGKDYFVLYKGAARTTVFELLSPADGYKRVNDIVNYVDVSPGNSLYIIAKVPKEEFQSSEDWAIRLAKLEVLTGYKVQLYLMDYSNMKADGENIWIKKGEPTSVPYYYFAGDVTYGGLIISESEQENDGIVFHDYFVTAPDGLNAFEKVKSEAKVWGARYMAGTTPTAQDCKNISQCLAAIDIKLVNDLKLAQ